MSEFDSNTAFRNNAQKSIQEANLQAPDALVLIGGNPEGCDVRQKAIFDIVNDCHKEGVKAYWYKTPHNASLDIPDQVIPGQTYVIVDFDVMSSSEIRNVQ